MGFTALPVGETAEFTGIEPGIFRGGPSAIGETDTFTVRSATVSSGDQAAAHPMHASLLTAPIERRLRLTVPSARPCASSRLIAPSQQQCSHWPQ